MLKKKKIDEADKQVSANIAAERPLRRFVRWFSRRHRVFLLWSRKWLRTSKPTEWMSSLASLLTVLSAIAAALFLILNGFFDQKKSELETKRSELSIQITKAEMDRERLAESKGYLETKLSDALVAIKIKEKELEELNRELGKSKIVLHLYKAQQEEIEKWDNVRSVFNRYSDASSRTQLKVFRNDPSEEHPRGIFGLEISSAQRIGPKLIGQHRDLEDILAAARHLSRVSVLSIDGIDIGPVVGSFLAGLESVHSLHLRRCGLDNRLIGKVSLPLNCRELDISGNNITSLDWLANPSRLLALNISETRIPEQEVLRIVEGAKELAELRFSATSLGDSILKAVSAKAPQLKRLECQDSSVTSTGVLEFLRDSKARRVICSAKPLKDKEGELKKCLEKNTYGTVVYLADESFDADRSYYSVTVYRKGQEEKSTRTHVRWFRADSD